MWYIENIKKKRDNASQGIKKALNLTTKPKTNKPKTKNCKY